MPAYVQHSKDLKFKCLPKSHFDKSKTKYFHMLYEIHNHRHLDLFSFIEYPIFAKPTMKAA